MKGTVSWIRGWVHRVPPLLLLNLCVLANVSSKGQELWEGSECVLEGGRAGMCVKIVDCPAKMLEIQLGNFTEAGRCGFSGFDEIVCCDKVSVRSKVGAIRPAVAACNTYKDWWATHAVDFVSGGVEVNHGEYPQIVALGYPAGPYDELVIDGKQYICGGTLISEQWILTAAHCVSNIHELVPVEVVILGNATDLTELRTNAAYHRAIFKIVKYPEYRRSRYYHDIALIQLDKPLPFRENVRPACLTTEPLPSSTEGWNNSFTVLGWGATDLDGTRSTKLLKAQQLKTIGMSECSVSYRNIKAQIPNGLDDGMICVVDPDTKKKSDTCQGDSGGPLFLGLELFPLLVGVTSFGQACGTGLPGIYASVYKYLDWIEAHVWPAGPPKSTDCWFLQYHPELLDYILTTDNKTSCQKSRLCRCIEHLI